MGGHPVEVLADQEAHLAALLGKRLSIADLKLPNLQTPGFRLVDGNLGYAVTGDVPRDLLQRIAEACYRQFPT